MAPLTICRSLRKQCQKSDNDKERKSHRGRKKRNAFHIQRGLIDRSHKGLQITELMKNVNFQTLPDLVYLEGCVEEQVTVLLDVQRFSGGSFLKGEVMVNLQLQCGRCGQPFSHPIHSHFKAWANPKINNIEESLDFNEIPFPPKANYLDITEVVGMAIEDGFPRLPVCGTPQCALATFSLSRETDWTITTDTTHTKNQFYVLEELRDTLKQQEP